jgi:putative acetyltransferase
MGVPEHDIRYTYITDISYLRSWINTPGMLHWFPMLTEKEVEDALQCWIGFSRWSASLTLTVNHVPCGIGTLFLMPYKKVAHHCLFKMIIDPKWQRKGLGTSLLKNLKHLAKDYFRLEMIYIEVFEGNPILQLLKKQDFYECAQQDKFVREDGQYFKRILMETKL